MYNCNNVNTALDAFKNIVLPIIDKHAPYKWMNLREKTALWVTNEPLSYIDEREFRCRKYNKQPTDANFLLKQECIRRVRRMCQMLQRNYLAQSIQECRGDSEVVNSVLHLCVRICCSSKLLMFGKTNKLIQVEIGCLPRCPVSYQAVLVFVDRYSRAGFPWRIRSGNNFVCVIPNYVCDLPVFGQMIVV